MSAFTQPVLDGLEDQQGAASPSADSDPADVEVTGLRRGADTPCPPPRPAVIRLGRDPHGRFTSAPEDAADEVTAAVHTDRLPNRVASRAAIREAVHEAAKEHGGEVHISWVREHLPPWTRGPQIGAALRMWTPKYLKPTGEYLPNGDPDPRARNASKPAPVKRLVRDIPEESL